MCFTRGSHNCYLLESKTTCCILSSMQSVSTLEYAIGCLLPNKQNHVNPMMRLKCYFRGLRKKYVDHCGRPPDLQWGHSNDHNSASIRVTELISVMVSTSRPARNSWDRSRSIPAYPSWLLMEILFVSKKITTCLLKQWLFHKKWPSKNKMRTALDGPGRVSARRGPGRTRPGRARTGPEW